MAEPLEQEGGGQGVWKGCLKLEGLGHGEILRPSSDLGDLRGLACS